MEDENDAIPQFPRPEQINMKECLSINFGILTLCGLWIPASLRGNMKRFLYRVYSAICIIFLVISPLITQIVDAIMVFGDLEMFVARMFLTVGFTEWIMKVYVVMRHHDRIEKLLDAFKEPIFSTVDVVSLETVRYTMRRHRRIVVVFVVLGEITISAFAMFPFMRSGEMDLPNPAWFPFDIHKSNRFVMVFIYQMISTYYAASTNISCHSLIAGIIAIAGGQVDLLCDKLADKHRRRGLVSTSDGHLVKDTRLALSTAENETKKHLHNCIEHHLNIIRYVEETNAIFGSIAFIHFFATTIIVCFAAFQLTVVKSLIESLAMVLYIACVVVELFLVCYFGNELSIKSQRLSLAAYESLWYESSLQNRKYLFIIMERAKTPLLFTAVITPLSLESFMAVMRSSYSYFAILRRVNNDDD